MKKIYLVFSALLLLSSLQAQTFTVDRTYGATSCGFTLVSNVGGVQTLIQNSKTLQSYGYPDGSVLTVYLINGGVEPGIGLVKVTATGQLDANFAGGGRTIYIPPISNSLFRMGRVNAVDTGGGKIVIVGGAGAAWIMSFNSNGSFNYFNYNPNSHTIYTVAVQPDGQAVVLQDANPGFCTRRYAANSAAIDPNYGIIFTLPPGSLSPLSIMGQIESRSHAIWQSNGKPVFCIPGTHRMPNGSDYNTMYLMRLHHNGTIDNGFGATGNDFVETGFGEACSGTALLADGYAFRKAAGDKMRIAATGATCQAKIMQFDAEGEVDAAWGNSGTVLLPGAGQNSFAHDLYVDPISDRTTIFGAQPSGGLIWRLNADGSFDNTFNNGSSRVGPIWYKSTNNGTAFKRAVGFGPERFWVTEHADDNFSGTPIAYTIISKSMISIKQTPQCPDVLLSVEQNTSCLALQWYKDGVLIPGATGNTYTATVDGNYYVTGDYNQPAGMAAGTTTSNTLAITTGCGGSVNVSDSENDMASFVNAIEPISLKAYPNPFSNRLNIEFALPEDSKVKLEIFNVEGQLLEVLYDGEVKSYEIFKAEYNTKNSPTSIIVYRLQTDDGSYYGKVMMGK